MGLNSYALIATLMWNSRAGQGATSVTSNVVEGFKVEATCKTAASNVDKMEFVGPQGVLVAKAVCVKRQ